MDDQILPKRFLSRALKARCLRRDREGIASTVGTIMALLVFLTLLSMFVNTYVPIWMKENERIHMNQVQDAMGEVKGKIDNLIVGAQVTGSSTVNTYQSVVLGSDGIPIFATATQGYLSLVPSGSKTTGVNVTFSYTANSQTVPFAESGGGKLEFYAPNRYFVEQWVTYENGAIIVKQDNGSAMKAEPSLKITHSQGVNTVVFTQVDLLGTNSSVTGTGIAGVNIDLIYVDTQTYVITGTSNAVTLTFTTIYNSTMDKFLTNTANNAGLTKNTDYTLTDTVISGSTAHKITFTIKNTETFTMNHAYVNIAFGE